MKLLSKLCNVQLKVSYYVHLIYLVAMSLGNWVTGVKTCSSSEPCVIIIEEHWRIVPETQNKLPASIVVENFPIHHFEAKTQLNKDLQSHFMKSGGFSLGCIKGTFVLLDGTDMHYGNGSWSLPIALIHVKAWVFIEHISVELPKR